jgi:hypothetical protein
MANQCIYFLISPGLYFHTLSLKHPHIQKMVQCIDLKERELVKRYSLDQRHTLHSLKTEGLVALRPIVGTPEEFIWSRIMYPWVHRPRGRNHSCQVLWFRPV